MQGAMLARVFGTVTGNVSKCNCLPPEILQYRKRWRILLVHRMHSAQAHAIPNVTPTPLQMMAWQVLGYDGIKGLTMNQIKTPPLLRPGEVLVRVGAASVNPIDTAIIGGYGAGVMNTMRMLGHLERGNLSCNQHEFPLTVGRDFAGEVVEIGQGVSSLAVGEKVWGVVSPQQQGSHAEFVVAAASNVCKMPPNLSLEEAASIPYVGLTAWSTVVVSGLLTQRSASKAKVLVLGASGGVGTFLIQLLSAWGAQVVGVCSHDAFDLVYGLNVVEVMDYRDPSTKEKLVKDRSFDLVINAAGMDDLQYIGSLKPWVGASYVTLSPPLLQNTDKYGLAGGFVKSLSEVMAKNLLTLSEGRSFKWAFYMPNPCALKIITKMVTDEQINPVIDKVFKFSETPEAYSHVSDGHARGKTVIRLH